MPTKRQSTIGLTDVESGGVDELSVLRLETGPKADHVRYYGTLQMGTPSQAITFDFDT